MFLLKSFSFYLLLITMAANLAYGDIEDLDGVPIPMLAREPLFVSLGSHCEPAHMLRACEMRKAAFPFDWIVSFDGEALLEILENNFQHFLNDKYFVPFGPAGHLANTYYHLEFLHDGDFNGDQFLLNMQNLKLKYQRRIERFRQLDNYKGKVFFVRAAYVGSTTDPHRLYHFEENLEISRDYSERLCLALENRFPHLDFCLIIINMHDRQKVEEEIRLSDNLLMIRANPRPEPPIKIEGYKKFFTHLLEKEALNNPDKKSEPISVE